MSQNEVGRQVEARTAESAGGAKPSAGIKPVPSTPRFYAEAVWWLNPGLPHALDLPVRR